MENEEFETLRKLLEFRNYLFFSDDVINFETALHGLELDSFVNEKVKISVAISELENIEFNKVKQQLALQTKNLQAGIDHLATQLKVANNSAKAIASLNSIFSILTGVLSIVKSG